MKKILPILLKVLVALLVIVIGFALFIQFRGVPSFEPVQGQLSVEVSPERVSRGEKLASVLCANCHADLNTGLLTGRAMEEAGDQFGKLYSQNITADKVHGIGNWTDWDIYYLLRTGIKKDGQYTPPYMAKLPHMANEDVYSIIAYLRSGSKAVAAAAVADKPCEPSWLTKFLCVVAFKPLPLPSNPILVPDSANTLDFGKYLAINLDCWTCHSEDFKTMNVMEPEKTPGYFSGGNPMVDLEGHTIPSLNLTPSVNGIGGWDEATFIAALKYGKVPGQEALRYPMVPYTRLTDIEAKAIYAYLKTIPANDKIVKRAVF